MPNPKEYDDQSSWMAVCVPKMKEEGKEQDVAVAACLNMWRNKDKTESNARAPLFSNAFREIEKAGKKFLVVPGIPVREQIMNTYLVPADEIARSVAGWNGTAISIQHPKSNNGSVNVPDPDVAIIGRFYNARWEPHFARMSGEYWIDIDEAMKWQEGETIIENVRAGNMLETSTGYYADDDQTPGEFNGRAYKTVHRNLLPDHIAILPNEVGACSVRDGCGVNRNVAFQNCECDCPYKNESLDQKLHEIRAAFEKEFSRSTPQESTSPSNLWVRKTFDDHLIIEDGTDLYKVNYGRDTEGNPIFTPRDEWIKVELLEQYVETNAEIPDYQSDHLPRAMLEGYTFNKGNRTPEQLDALRAHIKENGIDKPVIIMRMDDGEIKILDGNHRVSMAGEFNIDQIPVKVVNEQLEPIDPEMMYREWAHQKDQGYLNAILNGAEHPWHKGRPGEVGGSTSGGGGGSSVLSEKLQDAIRAAGQAMGEVKGRREEGYQDAYLALKKAAKIAEEEGHMDAYEKLMKKAAEYKKWADQYKPKKNQGDSMDIPEQVKNHPMFSEELYKRMKEKGMSMEDMMGEMDSMKSKQNRESRPSTSTTVTKTKKELPMKVSEFLDFLKGKGLQVKHNESGEFEVEEPTTHTDPTPVLSAEEITALKNLAASAAKLNALDDETLAAIKSVKVVANFARGLEEKEKAERTSLVASIKANAANIYSDEELAALSTPVLTKLNAQMNMSYAGLGGAQVFANEDDAPLGIKSVLLEQAETE